LTNSMLLKKSLCEIRNNHKWFLKPTKLYEGDVLTLWNEFKQLFDAKRKLDNSSLSEMYCKIKSEINDLGKGTIGVSTLENFYKQKTNPKPRTLQLVAS
jgi:hypothetical protein